MSNAHIAEYVAPCGRQIDARRLLRDYDVLLVRPYTCTKEAGHLGMHYDEPEFALWGSDWTAHIDGKVCE